MDVQGSKCPISYWVRMPLCRTDHVIELCGRAVLYIGSKLKGVPLQSLTEVFMKPLAAEATMKPLWCVVRSLIVILNACWPPPMLASNMWVLITSPGFISRVCLFGVIVARLDSCGLGGPVGTPLVWIQAKFTGSTQLLLIFLPAVASAEPMVSDPPQWVLF